MSNNLAIEVARVSDGDATKRMLLIADEPSCQFLNHLQISFCIGEPLVLSREQFADNKELQAITQLAGRTIRQIYLKENSNNSKGICYSRQIASVENRNVPLPLFDYLDIYQGSHNEGPLNRLDFAKIAEVAQNHFRVVSSKDLGTLLGPDVEKHFAAREEALTRLEALASRILEGSTTQRQVLDQEYLEKSRVQEDAHKLKMDGLEEQHNRRLEAISARELELDKKLKELDDRSSTHVRRELREKLKEAIKSENRLKFTRETGTRRWAVVIGYALILLFTGIPAIYFLMNDPGGTWNPWHFGRQVALSISFLATAGFFVRWLNAWAEKSSAEEFRLKQMEIDIDRASWLVELLFESRRDQGEELPIDLVHQLSKNLFGVAGNEQSEANAADTLATALLTSASGLKFSLPGGLGEIAFDGKGIKKLEKKSIPNE